MCGIHGVVSTHAVENRATLTCSSDALAHRGPDSSGAWWSPDGRVGLAHRRLAIIDLSAGGAQPMSRDAERLVLTFNGEIYNFRELRAELESLGHRFQSSSDTEVLLAAYDAWGERCVDRLDGMFALALYDSKRQTLFVARDRAGEKPLFYGWDGRTFRFASEIKAIFADRSFPRRIDPAGLDCYLALGYVTGDRCIVAGLKKLPPAHTLTFSAANGSITMRRYWEPPPFGGESITMPALLDELEMLLENSVRRQLVADVPVGVLLSGGVDSSLVTAMAVRAATHVKTFTVGFPGHAAFDERPHARLVAKHFETDHVELMAPESTADLLGPLAVQYDEPLADSSMFPTYLVSRLIREHCTVALGGDGGDELFGGYPHYPRLAWLESRFAGVPLSVRRLLSGAASLMPTGTRGRNWGIALGSDFSRDVPLIGSMFDVSARSRLLRPGVALPLDSEALRARFAGGGTDLVDRATRTDFATYLPDDILVKVDRASMLTSLEVRAPLLDRSVMEFAFGRVPSSLKATPSNRKILLKELAARLLPPEFDRHRKQGFSIPLRQWLGGGPWLQAFRDALAPDPASPFEPRAVEALFDGQRRGRVNAERLFALAQFETWRRHYDVATQ
jgi:asparagine synthase (glutamine-hydrolysing)